MSYPASPTNGDGFCPPDFYDAAGSIALSSEEAFLPNSHSIFAPQPLRRPSLMSIQSSSSSQPDLNLDTLSVGQVPSSGTVSPAESFFSPVPEYFNSYDSQNAYFKYVLYYLRMFTLLIFFQLATFSIPTFHVGPAGSGPHLACIP